MLAPINTPTGDGRRIMAGGFTHRPLPLPLKWQRSDSQGHDDSVVIGSMDKIEIGDDAVWGEGELFDDVNPATNPRLAEDVAEAKLLSAKKVIGPSVDPGSAKGMTVLQGQDTPATDAMFEKAWMLNPGDPPPTEMLFTDYEIAAATLVPIPAFAECRPFELLGAAPSALTAAARDALLADRLTMPDLELFDDPKLDRVTPLTRRELANGWTHVFGHIATHDVCHVGIRNTCTTAPYSELDYREFHRYEATDDGTVEFPIAVGRLTAAYGALSDACRCCRGNDDHACDMLSLGAAIAHHDQMDVLAYGRVGEDENNNAIWFSGVEAPGIDERGVALLNRQKVSGDWRPFAGGLELAEVLVLSHRNPGFPLPRVAMRGGRQSALVAAGTVRPNLEETDMPEHDLGVAQVSRAFAELGDALGRTLNRLALPAHERERTGVTAAARTRGWSSLPVASGDPAWDVNAAKRRLDDWAGDDISGKYARAFLWRDPDGDPDLKGSYKLPIADIIGGRLTIVPAGVRAAASYLPKTDGISADEQAAIRAVLDTLLNRTREKRGDMAYDGEDGDGCGPSTHRMPDGTCMDDDEMTVTAAAPEGGHTGAMVALRMTEQDAARLCATGGLPMDELHTTFCYLGESDQIDQPTRDRIISDMREFAASQPGPIPADGFALNAFNPGNMNDRDTAIVLGVGGQELADAHAMASEVWGGWSGEDGTWTVPEQHSPWVPHVTLQYTDDLNAVKRLADRVGPLSFDRVRVAFGNDVVDIPLGAPNTGGEQVPADEAKMATDPKPCADCGKFDACATCADCGGVPTLSSRAEQALMSLRLAEANLLLTK